MWRSSDRQARLSQEEHLPIEQLKESKLIVKCFLQYCAEDKQEINVLFDMLTIFSVRTLADFTFLKEFYKQVASQYSSSRKRDILNRFLEIFKDMAVQCAPALTLAPTPASRSADGRRQRAPLTEVPLARGVLSAQ